MQPTRPQRRLGRFAVPVLTLVLGLFLGQALAGGESTPGPKVTAPAAPRAPKVVDGVRTGWAHSEAGAVQAATHYQLVIGAPLMFDPIKRQAAIHAMADPAAEEELQGGHGRAASLVEQGLGLAPGGAATASTAVRNLAAGYRVTSYSDEEASIDIWTIGIGGLGAVEPMVGFGTATVHVRWTEGDWRLVSTRSVPGPVPASMNQPVTPAAEFISAVATFKEYPHAP